MAQDEFLFWEFGRKEKKKDIGKSWSSANGIPNRGRKLTRRDVAAAREQTAGGAAVRRATGGIKQVSRCDTDCGAGGAMSVTGRIKSNAGINGLHGTHQHSWGLKDL